MPVYRAPRGTRDLLPDERVGWMRLERLAAEIAGRYGYRPIETPMFEQSAVYERGLGEATDAVEKELFRLAPRTEDGEVWALRPEPTAGIVRAYIQHGMQTWPQPVKLTCTGPMFRYDRPQAGRFRQFWQFDVEAIGDPGPAVDAEIIELGLRFYREAGLSDVEVRLNSIGDPACRPAYLEDLVGYYRGHLDAMPAFERGRLERNPLRLLDSKDPVMVVLNADAPRIVDRLCDACADHFAGVKGHLDALGIAYRLEPGLVRGLDYYTRTAIEFYRPGADGQQSALGGGGRYDGLVELLGGRPTPGIGFGLGLDRVMLELHGGGASEAWVAGPLAVVVGVDPDATADRLVLATTLRAAGLRARAELGRRKLGRQLEAASKEGAHFAVILGGDGGDGSSELRDGHVEPRDGSSESRVGHVELRDLQAGTQRSVPMADLVRELRRADETHQHG